MSDIVLDLGKKFELNLQKVGFTQVPTMRVRLATDKSGSMDSLFRNGFVEKTIELFMGVASKFDDNAELEYSFFNTSADSMKSVGLSNYKRMGIPSAGGGTNYMPVLNELMESGKKATGVFGKLFGGAGKTSSNEPPVYIGFITDGEPNDLNETLDAIREASSSPNFIQFIVLGNTVNKRILDELAKNPNVSYHIIPNPMSMTVDELYEAIANTKLLDWYKGL